MAGVAIGGFLWVVIAGRLIRDPAISLSGAALGIAIWWLGSRSLIRYQSRRLLVLGLVFVCVAVADWAFLAVVLPRLPEGGSIYLGTSRSAYQLLQPMLLAIGAVGSGLALWDLLRRS